MLIIFILNTLFALAPTSKKSLRFAKDTLSRFEDDSRMKTRKFYGKFLTFVTPKQKEHKMAYPLQHIDYFLENYHYAIPDAQSQTQFLIEEYQAQDIEENEIFNPSEDPISQIKASVQTIKEQVQQMNKENLEEDTVLWTHNTIIIKNIIRISQELEALEDSSEHLKLIQTLYQEEPSIDWEVLLDTDLDIHQKRFRITSNILLTLNPKISKPLLKSIVFSIIPNQEDYQYLADQLTQTQKQLLSEILLDKVDSLVDTIKDSTFISKLIYEKGKSLSFKSMDKHITTILQIKTIYNLLNEGEKEVLKTQSSSIPWTDLFESELGLKSIHFRFMSLLLIQQMEFETNKYQEFLLKKEDSVPQKKIEEPQEENQIINTFVRHMHPNLDDYSFLAKQLSTFDNMYTINIANLFVQAPQTPQEKSQYVKNMLCSAIRTYLKTNSDDSSNTKTDSKSLMFILKNSTSLLDEEFDDFINFLKDTGTEGLFNYNENKEVLSAIQQLQRELKDLPSLTPDKLDHKVNYMTQPANNTVKEQLIQHFKTIHTTLNYIEKNTMENFKRAAKIRRDELAQIRYKKADNGVHRWYREAMDYKLNPLFMDSLLNEKQERLIYLWQQLPTELSESLQTKLIHFLFEGDFNIGAISPWFRKLEHFQINTEQWKKDSLQQRTTLTEENKTKPAIQTEKKDLDQLDFNEWLQVAHQYGDDWTKNNIRLVYEICQETVNYLTSLQKVRDKYSFQFKMRHYTNNKNKPMKKIEKLLYKTIPYEPTIEDISQKLVVFLKNRILNNKETLEEQEVKILFEQNNWPLEKIKKISEYCQELHQLMFDTFSQLFEFKEKEFATETQESPVILFKSQERLENPSDEMQEILMETQKEHMQNMTIANKKVKLFEDVFYTLTLENILEQQNNAIIKEFILERESFNLPFSDNEVLTLINYSIYYFFYYTQVFNININEYDSVILQSIEKESLLFCKQQWQNIVRQKEFNNYRQTGSMSDLDSLSFKEPLTNSADSIIIFMQVLMSLSYDNLIEAVGDNDALSDLIEIIDFKSTHSITFLKNKGYSTQDTLQQNKLNFIYRGLALIRKEALIVQMAKQIKAIENVDELFNNFSHPSIKPLLHIYNQIILNYIEQEQLQEPSLDTLKNEIKELIPLPNDKEQKKIDAILNLLNKEIITQEKSRIDRYVQLTSQLKDSFLNLEQFKTNFRKKLGKKLEKQLKLASKLDQPELALKNIAQEMEGEGFIDKLRGQYSNNPILNEKDLEIASKLIKITEHHFNIYKQIDQINNQVIRNSVTNQLEGELPKGILIEIANKIISFIEVDSRKNPEKKDQEKLDEFKQFLQHEVKNSKSNLFKLQFIHDLNPVLHQYIQTYHQTQIIDETELKESTQKQLSFYIEIGFINEENLGYIIHFMKEHIKKSIFYKDIDLKPFTQGLNSAFFPLEWIEKEYLSQSQYNDFVRIEKQQKVKKRQLQLMKVEVVKSQMFLSQENIDQELIDSLTSIQQFFNEIGFEQSVVSSKEANENILQQVTEETVLKGLLDDYDKAFNQIDIQNPLHLEPDLDLNIPENLIFKPFKEKDTKLLKECQLFQDKWSKRIQILLQKTPLDQHERIHTKILDLFEKISDSKPNENLKTALSNILITIQFLNNISPKIRIIQNKFINGIQLNEIIQGVYADRLQLLYDGEIQPPQLTHKINSKGKLKFKRINQPAYSLNPYEVFEKKWTTLVLTLLQQTPPEEHLSIQGQLIILLTKLKDDNESNTFTFRHNLIMESIAGILSTMRALFPIQLGLTQQVLLNAFLRNPTQKSSEQKITLTNFMRTPEQVEEDRKSLLQYLEETPIQIPTQMKKSVEFSNKIKKSS